ncbi:hypothetical protein M0804_006833 [Polistes exclamans]|nr:hypothetical protein M0804_006833 [Polistes exclamans]
METGLRSRVAIYAIKLVPRTTTKTKRTKRNNENDNDDDNDEEEERYLMGCLQTVYDVCKIVPAMAFAMSQFIQLAPRENYSKAAGHWCQTGSMSHS